MRIDSVHRSSVGNGGSGKMLSGILAIAFYEQLIADPAVAVFDKHESLPAFLEYVKEEWRKANN